MNSPSRSLRFSRRPQNVRDRNPIGDFPPYPDRTHAILINFYSRLVPNHNRTSRLLERSFARIQQVVNIKQQPIKILKRATMLTARGHSHFGFKLYEKSSFLMHGGLIDATKFCRIVFHS